LSLRTICVVGLGYIGLPTASTFASQGVSVLGVDVDTRVLAILQQGEIHIHEQGLHEMFQAAIASGNLKLASQPAAADAFIIAVPTPFYNDRMAEHEGIQYKMADMRAVISAAESILPVLRPGNLVVLESTSPPGTTVEVLAPILARSGLDPGRDFHLAYSPERVLPGQILRELRENARVVGGVTAESGHAAAELYKIFVQGEIIETDATTAELVKLMENTYRDVNIAIANEFSHLADKFGVDVWEAISLANRHPRVKILNPGPGVGGHCISVDPWFLVERAPELTTLIAAARSVNDGQPKFLVEVLRRALGALRGKRITALGLAYKPYIDDVRESPAVEVVHLLQNEGATVMAWEPFKPGSKIGGVTVAASLEEALSSADAIVLLVRHRELASMTPTDVARQTTARVAIDAVNGWDGAAWRAAGFRYVLLGAPNR
jgi:UDP-N-acetyl-D-mannosaminuronic acid dehydrogenase